MEAVIARLHRCLLDAIRERGADALDRPVTVAEIYQELVPYRAVRERLGVELNADYEHALIRLLAGEGGRVRLEPTTAREELQQELTTPNPYVGLYRKFAGCDVWLTQREAPDLPEPDAEPVRANAAGAPASSAAPPAAGPGARPAASAPAAAAAPRAASRPAPVATDPVPAHARDGAAAPCTFCRQALPAGRAVRYCPFCGKDQQQRPCGSCGEVLEVGWRYCVACGAAAGPDSRSSPAAS